MDRIFICGELNFPRGTARVNLLPAFARVSALNAARLFPEIRKDIDRNATSQQ